MVSRYFGAFQLFSNRKLIYPELEVDHLRISPIAKGLFQRGPQTKSLRATCLVLIEDDPLPEGTHSRKVVGKDGIRLAPHDLVDVLLDIPFVVFFVLGDLSGFDMFPWFCMRLVFFGDPFKVSKALRW